MMRAWPLSWLRPRGMQARLTWGALVLVLAALGVLGGYTAHEQAQISRHATLAEARALAHNVALSAVDPVLTNSLDVLEDLALRAADVGEVRALAVLRPDGRTLVRVLRQPLAAAGQRTRLQYDPPSRRDTVPSPGAEAQWLEVDGHLVAWQPVQAGGDLAWVRLDVGLQAMHEARRRIWRNTAVVACVAALACALLTWWGLRRPMRLLRQASGFARALADASGRQLSRVPAPQEIEELTDALNEASLLLCQQMILLEDNLGAMQSQKARLAEQHGQLAAIFAHSHDGLVTFDRAGRLQFVNQAFLALTGLSEAALQGHDLAHLDTLLRALSDEQRPWAGLLAPPPSMAEADAPGAFNAPLVLHLAGDPRRVLSITCERHTEGPVGALVYACDVTRQHQLDEMKSEFLSMAAHELRTPMVSIFGFTELMLKREMSVEQRQDLLGRIHRRPCKTATPSMNTDQTWQLGMVRTLRFVCNDAHFLGVLRI
jgi:PAS domain-containing protein